MALILSSPTSSAASVSSPSVIFWNPAPRRSSCLYTSKQPSSPCSRCTLKAPPFATAPSPSCRKVMPFSSLVARGAAAGGGYFSTEIDDTRVDMEVDDEDGGGSPWEGAVVYRRDAYVTHLEYGTTLERLGLGNLSSELSRSRASAMGIRLISLRKGGAPAEDPSLAGTPVLVSVDVARKKRKLKLDGVVRTVITLGCNRCAEPAAEGVFSNFSLLLSEDPIEEPKEIDMGVIYGKAAFAGEREESDGEHLIDPDDRIYFPAEEREVDISKHIRDMVHVEITINAVCDASCKGLCLKCGTNLNKGRCNCHKRDAGQSKSYGPLGNLKEQMQHG